MLSWIHVFDFINAGFIFDYGQYHRQYYASVVADVILGISSGVSVPGTSLGFTCSSLNKGTVGESLDVPVCCRFF